MKHQEEWAPFEGSNRIIRGGSWNNNASNCRSSNRNDNNPSNRNNNNGFRLAFPPSPSRAPRAQTRWPERCPDRLGQPSPANHEGGGGAGSPCRRAWVERSALPALLLMLSMPAMLFSLHGDSTEVAPFAATFSSALVADFDGNGTPDAFEDFDGNGAPEVFEDFDGNGTPEALEDLNGDGFPDAFMDADGDGVPDVFNDADNNAVPDAFEDGDGNGTPDGFEDRDGDLLFDSLQDFYPLKAENHPAFRYGFHDTSTTISWPNFDPLNRGRYFYTLNRDIDHVITVAGAFEFTDQRSVSFENLEHGRWHLHVVPLDETDTPVAELQETFGFRVAALPPVLSSSSHPSSVQPMLAREFEATITPPVDIPAESYVRFYYRFDNDALTVPTREDLSTTEPVISSGPFELGWHWLHVVAEDRLGNLSAPAHYGFIVTEERPLISSDTHPDQGRVYALREPALEWQAPRQETVEAQRQIVQGMLKQGQSAEAIRDLLLGEAGNAQEADLNADGVLDAADLVGLLMPEPTATPTPTDAPTTSPTPTPSVTATATPAESPSPTATPAITPTPSVSPTPSSTPTISPTPSPSLTPSPTPSPTPTPVPGNPGFFIELNDDPFTDPLYSGEFTTSTARDYSTLEPGTYFFHVRYRDAFGYLSPTSSFRINIAEAQAAPALSSSTHPEPGTAYPEREATVTMSNPDGVTDTYYYVVSMDEDAEPTLDSSSTESTTLNLTDLQVGTNYLHVRSRSRYGALSETSTLPLNVRLSRAPVITSPTHPDPLQNAGANPRFEWSNPDGDALTARYYFVLDQNGATEPTRSAESSTSKFKQYVARDPGTYWFHIRGEDRYGDLTATARYRVTVSPALPPGATPTPTQTPTPTPTPAPSLRTEEKVIIVAGGGDYPGNAIADETEALANFAHFVTTTRGVSAEDILYLSAFGVAGNVDGAATITDFEQGLRQFARDANKLTIFLFDHGERLADGEVLFLLDGTTSPRQFLGATRLDGLLDEIQSGADPLRDIAVIVDMCFAGGFVERASGAPEGMRRIVMASTASDRLASFAGRDATLSFGRFFLSKIGEGANFYEAFTIARGSIISLNVPREAPQAPVFDDNGDGVQTAREGLAALNWRLGDAPSFGDLPPELLNARPNATIPAPADFTLWCQLGPGDSGIVRAYISSASPVANPNDPITAYEEIVLQPDPVTAGRWTGTLPASALAEDGVYNILYTAEEESTAGSGIILQATPIGRTLTVGGGG